MDWAEYWLNARDRRRKNLYALMAEFYRNQLIARSAACVLSEHFQNHSAHRYLHAGCGSGGSDRLIALDQPQFHFLDLSPVALSLHREQPLRVKRVDVCADIFSLPYAVNTFNGIFNFGVMEHFPEHGLSKILSEFHRVLKADGTLVLFWPPEFGLSVLALKGFLGVVNRFREVPLELHPPEISRIKSFRWVRDLMARHHFRVVTLEFGWRDLFTHVIVVAQRA